MATHSFNRFRTIAALDLGSFKVSCVIAHVSKDSHQDNKIDIVGYSCVKSNGIEKGLIVDINQAKNSIYQAIDVAEHLANERIESVIVNISSDKVKSSIRRACININKNRPISADDLNNVLAHGMEKVNITDAEIIHCIPTSYQLDDAEYSKDPRGLYAEKLAINILLGVLPSSTYRNISNVVESVCLDVEDMAFSAYADALSCLVDDEKKFGATVIDIGGEMTHIVTYKNGCPVQFSSIPLGGNNITNDIAWVLSTSFKHAESLKTLHGNVILTSQDKTENINVYPVGEEDDTSVRVVPKAELIGIITARVEEIFEIINKKLDEHGLKNVSNHRIVLTGGCSQLRGIRNIASVILDKHVRLGVPKNLPNIPQALCGPEFSTVLGLLMYAVNNSQKDTNRYVNSDKNYEGKGFFGKIFARLKQNF